MLRTAAQIISVIFHPLLMLTYMLIILLLVNPYLFGINDISDGIRFILIVFFPTFLIPLFGIFMMKVLGMISSLEMRDSRDRIGPFILTGIFYLWMYKNFLESAVVPMAFTVFTLGTTIGLFVAFFINLFSKISLHALGAGGLVGMVAITMWLFSDGVFNIPLGSYHLAVSINLLLIASIVIAGLIGTARLILDAHEPMDLYGGFLVGLGSMFIAMKFLI